MFNELLQIINNLFKDGLDNYVKGVNIYIAAINSSDYATAKTGTSYIDKGNSDSQQAIAAMGQIITPLLNKTSK